MVKGRINEKEIPLSSENDVNDKFSRKMKNLKSNIDEITSLITNSETDINDILQNWKRNIEKNDRIILEWKNGINDNLQTSKSKLNRWVKNHRDIVLSNGPGNPKMCKEAIENVRKAFIKNIPILGICLGSQILGLAAGASTYKLKYGHRSQNQPCVEVGTKKCYINSQNHGYAVDSDTLPEDWREWFYNNNDKTNEGIIHISKPFFGAQFHPEASPGPDDTEFLFDMFLRAMKS